MDRVLKRVLGGLLALALGLLAVFVFTAFAALAAVLAAVVLARAWWQSRSVDPTDDGKSVTVEYSVTRDDSDSAREPDAILPPRGPRR